MSRLDAIRLSVAKAPALVLAGSLAVLLLLITLKNLLTGTPDARLPASSLFETPEISVPDPMLRDEGLGDFEERPLFSESRRPFVPEAQEVSEVPEQVAPPPRQTLKGWSLLGIFNSGEVEGAIVRQKDGKRRRVLVGEVTGGWQLSSVEPRRAVFRSETSSDEAELTMSLVSLEGLVREVSAAEAGENVPSDNSDADAAAAEESSADDSVRAEQAPQRRDPTVFGGGINRDG